MRFRAKIPFALLALAALTPGCFNSSSEGAKAANDWVPKGVTRCSVAASRSEPLVVEWPSLDRAKLEALFKQGLVAVRYNGCEMQVLPDCTASSQYRYMGTLPKHDLVRIRNSDELFASLPVGAASLEATLAQSSELQVKMSVVGRYQSERRGVRMADLTGSCSKATHVISGLIVGGFEFSSVKKDGQRVKASPFGVGVGEASESEKDIISKDGDLDECRGVQGTEAEPPSKCRAVLRIEVTPLPEVENRLAAESAERVRQEQEQREAQEGRAVRRRTGMVVGGLGAVAGIAGYYLIHKGQSEYDDVQGGGFATGRDIQDAIDRGNRDRAMGWPMLGIGSAAAVSGAVLYWMNREPSKDQSQTVGQGTVWTGAW